MPSPPNPANYPVVLGTLLAPAIAWVIARYLPGLELTEEQSTYIASLVLVAGSGLATRAVRSKRTLPNPDAVKGETVRRLPPASGTSSGGGITPVIEPTTYGHRTQEPPFDGP